MIRKYVLLLMIMVFVSCNTSKSVIQTTRKGSKTNPAVERNYKKPTSQKSSGTQTLQTTDRVKLTNEMILAYIEKYNVVAQTNRDKYGIPASIILGQAILESGSGTGALCVLANNHFGIKCHKDWTGASIKYDDDTADECFRKYDNPYDSFRDHALFLTAGSRYIPLFKLGKKDYKSWAKGLKEAGYATDSLYPTKLIALIERFQLYKYDGVSLEKEPVYTTERIATNASEYRVSPGDTLYSISKKFRLSIDELKSKNNMSDNVISIGQSLKVN